jgi:AraC-like DNA-binding protein
VRGDLMQVPTPSGREAIHAFLLAQAREQIASQGKGATIMQVVRVIEARISDPDLSPLTVARSLSLSQRTLQRQLADAGTTFRDLLASVRRRRRDELARKGLGAAEIAPHLGFASAKTMRRSLNDNRGSVEANEPRQNAA